MKIRKINDWVNIEFFGHQFSKDSENCLSRFETISKRMHIPLDEVVDLFVNEICKQLGNEED